jgi:hypothetical protein
MPKEGFEPSLPNGNYALNVARLPIPPLRRAVCIVSETSVLSTLKAGNKEMLAIVSIILQVPYTLVNYVTFSIINRYV